MEYRRQYNDYTERFEKQIKKVMAGVSDSKLMSILSKSLQQAVKAVVINKKKSLKNFGSFAVRKSSELIKFTKGEYTAARKNYKAYIANIPSRIVDESAELGKNTWDYIQERIRVFGLLTTIEKRDLILSGLIWTGTILLIGGGTDMEGGVPDLDIELSGIGEHRNVFSHGILLPLVLEFLLRILVNLTKESRDNIPKVSSPLWSAVDTAAKILEENENVMVSGIWIGSAIHFFKDANLFSSGVKPYTGIPVSIPIEGHKAIFAGNSFLSFVFGSHIKKGL